MIKKITFVVLAFLYLNSQAQNHRNCGTTNYMNYLISQDSSIVDRMNQGEVAIKKWINEHGQERQKSVITIPVVVHVLYQFNVQNISDAQIQSQIAILNEDYRRLNADRVNTPALFKSVAADVEIEFCFAHQDPNGNWTNGVTRTQTTKSSFDLGANDAKSNATGGHDIWNRDKYLNIWVVPQIKDGPESGILGYSQFPGGPASTDGIVIAYQYFGNTGTAVAPFNKGRTTTHELGHWLNLYHIWGDDNGSCSGSDYVQDTPNQSNYNYSCPTFPHPSCSNTSDMFMNYMDYTDDICMNIFTEGQKQRMLAVLNTSRASLKTSDKCQIVSLPEPSNKEELKIYPNPSKGEFMLDFSGLNIESAVDIRVYNALGQLVFAKNYQNISNQEQIDLPNSTNGIYMLHINSEQFSVIRKIEIQR